MVVAIGRAICWRGLSTVKGKLNWYAGKKWFDVNWYTSLWSSGICTVLPIWLSGICTVLIASMKQSLSPEQGDSNEQLIDLVVMLSIQLRVHMKMLHFDESINELEMKIWWIHQKYFGNVSFFFQSATSTFNFTRIKESCFIALFFPFFFLSLIIACTSLVW